MKASFFCPGVPRFQRALFILVSSLLTSLSPLLPAATLPSGFSESILVEGLSSPTAMEFAPDGRLFVCQQNGQLRVIKNLALLAAPFVSLTTDPSGERGLLGIAFDPGFVTNQFLYVYYTATTPTIHNRVSRFTANGDVAVVGSEVRLLDLEDLNASNHNGGAIHFGADGKLYVAVGENAVSSNAQTLANRLGKMLRINRDGTLPTDNPFFSVATGVNRSIWALGLRNPFTFAVQPVTGRLFINDVGQGEWEEINDGVRGANYGWPNCEGRCVPTQSQFLDPIFQYAHGRLSTNGCDITGGAFYNPVACQYPPSYRGIYFFADACGQWIRRLDPNNGNGVTDFASSVPGPVDLKVSAEGRLLYLARGDGSVRMIDYVNSPPTLGIAQSGSTVTLLWPAPTADFILQTTSTLSPSAGWTTLSASVLSTNGQNRVVLPASGTVQFFRLVNP